MWKDHCIFCHDDEFDIKLLKNFLQVFELVEQLGEGSYGDVYLVKTICEKDDEHYFALKILKDPMEDKPVDKETINRETLNIEQISKFPHCHPSFVCFYDAFCFTIDMAALGAEVPEGKPQEEKFIGILTEFIDGYDLYEYCKKLRKIGKQISPSFVSTIAEWLLYSISVLHSQDIMHRDIKPENIMITNEHKLKLLDFGLSCQTEEETDFKTKKIICEDNAGTRGFAAPEIYTGEYKNNKKKYYRTSDAFSIGATLYFLLTMRKPYVMLPDKWIYMPLDYSVPPELTYLIEKLLEIDPDKRMGVNEAYQKFKKYNLSQAAKRPSR